MSLRGTSSPRVDLRSQGLLDKYLDMRYAEAQAWSMASAATSASASLAKPNHASYHPPADYGSTKIALQFDSTETYWIAGADMLMECITSNTCRSGIELPEALHLDSLHSYPSILRVFSQ